MSKPARFGPGTDWSYSNNNYVLARLLIEWARTRQASSLTLASQFIPGWPYSFVAVLEMGATSRTQILDAVRLGPADGTTAITAGHIRGAVERLIAAGQWAPG